VALEETKVHLEVLGLPGDRITISGIPIDPAFAQPVNRAAVKSGYGLRKGIPTLLLSAGAIGAASTEFIVQRLRDQLKTQAQVIVICGRNENLQKRIAAEVGTHGPKF
jgi:processive 1,2-diacylglycerol beta-glucosyltransferase